MLYRSVAKALYANGKVVTKNFDKVNEFLAPTDTDIPILVDRYKSASFKYKAITLPRLVVLDKYGTVKKYKVGFNNPENFEQELEELIDGLLKE